MKNLLDYSMEEISAWMKENGESAFRAKQVFSWIYNNVWEFENMKNLPKALINKLKENFYIGIPEIVAEYNSTTDETKKILFAFQDKNIIESVIMKYNYGNTICISTQVGCRMGCKFCASTLEGRVRNLTAGEILSEVIVAQKVLGERISNIVLMGSGEPLDNYENVTKFLDLVNAEYGLNIGQRHITLSTCGLVPKIYDLANKGYSITLAISLHAFNDEKRREIMPIAKKYSIKEILEACDYYFEKTGRRISFEYSLVSGINDGKEDALSLSKLLKGRQCHINLIPVNEIKENTLKRPSKKTIEEFEKIVSNHGLDVTVRKEMGNDINAACGQLRRNFLKTKN
ncbi:MAG: 23S rRNA (adenine(2503)-C(2))-methyltransferase RlmN [Clostridium sp.]|jgi:23S rRNA m2A2503 methyltransferase|uniref:23S rRNA (adenine(2503)-C(2))-methyltransferase RlmN n=1 Tax=Clostridium sp. TaxID=1506 RepID=UPI0025CE7EB2|nr:23S rRNA (adenine(2503)-C(2))-methyltransferase RlmN [Clostridium sp.]MCI6692740.1 23S rRNA (adenine(2503)-C(2))-methyltransferase RlmN [Clostridium sp.]MDY2632043.1 23S rRNA (adenine(2503)-C(2))-methyltransferase RlmN [Clostridium sp.]